MCTVTLVVSRQALSDEALALGIGSLGCVSIDPSQGTEIGIASPTMSSNMGARSR